MAFNKEMSVDELSAGIPFVRNLEPKMGMALARRTVFRKEDKEDWGRVATRVSQGNCLLANGISWDEDFEAFRNKIAKGIALMSGRHLQHGDASQVNRNIEIFSNCSTSSSSFIKFLLLLSGSGVGRIYDDAMMLVDWSKAPLIMNVCSPSHPDYDARVFSPVQRRLLATDVYFKVPDSREGWAQAFEIYERMAFEGTHKDICLMIDWSDVRPKGSPIGGMQDRPASGPVPAAAAFKSCNRLRKEEDMPRWKQTMLVDHYLAECVVVGGARRSARLACKNWRDPGAIEFALLKRQHPELWSSNNSLIVDAEFWKQEDPWAVEILNSAAYASYHDGTGEPGFINVDRFAPDEVDADYYQNGFAQSEKFAPSEHTVTYMDAQAEAFKGLRYKHIVNPCGEIALIALGGYCVIGDVAPYHADTIDEAEETFRLVTRALIRANTMPALYQKELNRTNRIGVSFTGIHEFAWKFFGLTFNDMLDHEGRGKYFWKAMSRFSKAVKDEAKAYATRLGVAIPKTDTTVKPAGSTSKLYGLTEGAHLASMREYLRWVQFRSDDPLVKQYADFGYPTKELTSYSGTTVVGFPTQPEICKTGMPRDQIVTAAEATPEEQYKWLQLVEKYWIQGSEPVDTGNQVSFTLKYDPTKVDYAHFLQMMKEYQPTIKCCSVMPQIDTTAYEYQPEETVTADEFKAILANIKDPSVKEEFDVEALQCASGACPI